MALKPIALSRRGLLAGGLALPLTPAGAWAAPRALAFAVFRNGVRIGEHRMTFSTAGDGVTVATEAVMTVRLGPVPVFRYRHHAVERRAGETFQSLQTTTETNGKTQRLSAENVGGLIRLEGSAGSATAPAGSNPLTHWNPAVFAGPLFDPQNGKMMKVRTARVAASHWQIRGQADIDDYYDDAGAWLSLNGKLDDGSRIEYRRL